MGKPQVDKTQGKHTKRRGKKHGLNRTMIYWCVNSISKRLPEGTSNCCELGIRDLSELRVIKASEFLGGTSNHQHEIECDFRRMDVDTHS